MKSDPSGSFGAQLKALRQAAGFTQEELATIAGLSVHGVSALERGERRRPQVETLRALSAALDLPVATRDALWRSARASAGDTAVVERGVLSLPLPPTSLLGRDADLDTLRQWLADPLLRLITLTGPGGAGKTRLAIEVAHAVAADHRTRVAFVPLAATRDPAFVASAIAEVLGLSDVMAADLPLRARVACAGASTLLLLDNFEQVLDAAALVGDLLAAVASLRVLVTSRAPLRLRGEREYSVGPLALHVGSEAMSPEHLSRAPAVRLFVERAQDVRPGFRLTATNGPIIAALCQRLDALPLALELAASWMKVLSAEELLRRLDQNVLLSTTGLRDLPARQQTINATVAWSYQLLEAKEQHGFRRFGVLHGRFPIEAAAAVLGDSGSPASGDEALAVAAGLIDKSLLLRSESSASPRPMYQMLETVRAYAALELAAVGERDHALEGLARYCIDEASRAAKGLMGPGQVAWLNRVRDDLESYRSTLDWLLARNRAAEASDIAWQLKYFWLIRGHAVEGLRWYQRIRDLPSLPASAESKALLGAASMWWTQGDLARARAALPRALSLAESVGDMETVAHAAHVSAHVAHALGDEEAARHMFTRSIDTFRALSIPSGTGNALNGMAVLALAKGDTSTAERLLEEATSVLRQVGPWFLTWALYVRGILAVRRGDADRAIAFVRESLTCIRDHHDKFAFVYALVPLVAAAALKHDEAWVARILGARDGVTERTGVMVSDNSVQDLLTRAESDARARLGPDQWALAYTAGRTSTIDAVLKDIDRVLRKARVPIEGRAQDDVITPTEQPA
jgi:predicted ATPase/DNA-binding XRE family transcriptional regulator